MNRAAVFLWAILAASSAAAAGSISVEGGGSAKIFAASPYGGGGQFGMIRAATEIESVRNVELGVAAARWSSPYSDNTVVGATAGYKQIFGGGKFFARAVGGPFFGDKTVRTATRWSIGLNLSAGVIFQGGEVF